MSTSVRIEVTRTSNRTLRGWAAVLLFTLYPLARCAVAALGLIHGLGVGWGVVVVSLAVCLRWTALWQLAALLTLVRLWHWPLLAALVCVAPRLLMILPGLVNTGLARLRHPPPRWDAWQSAEVPRPGSELQAAVPRPDSSSTP